LSILDQAEASGAKPVRQPTLDKLSEEILDEIAEARQAGFSWNVISDALMAEYEIQASGDALMRNVPKVRPAAR
jgi:hypothetical protein